jgi:alpha-N-arabinofuranosidase
MNLGTRHRWLLPRREFLRATAMMSGCALCEQLIPFLDAQENTASAAGTFTAAISVRGDSILHKIDPKIYGTMIEHIGRGVYGGIYEEDSPLSDEDGFRKDVLAAGKEWGIPVFRWPGGNFASDYHWIDGIGPKASRPKRYSYAWFEVDNNHFGTHEYIAYCRKLGTEPYMCVNLGTGTPEEAANWVQYCNGTSDSYFPNLRRKNGHEEPFNVKYWGLGNEVYGEWQVGHQSAEGYANLALEAAKLMKWADPDIRVVAVGHDLDWNRTVLETLVHIADYISIHDYEGSPDYKEMLGSIQRFEKHIHDTEALIDLTDHLRIMGDRNLESSLPKNKERIEIAIDEWNVWYRAHNFDYFTDQNGEKRRKDLPNPAEEVYNMRDALWVASALNLFQRTAKSVTMANLAQMVNILAPMLTSKTGLILQPTYFPMKLYRQQSGANYLQAQVTSPTFSSKSFIDVPYLDISATTDDARTFLALAVVNRHETQAASTNIRIDGMKLSTSVDNFEIVGPPDAQNTTADPHKIDIQQKKIIVAGSTFDYSFPPHSVTMLKFNRTGT